MLPQGSFPWCLQWLFFTFFLPVQQITYDAAKADHEYRTMLQDARTGVNLTTTEAMQVFSQGTAVSGLPEFNGPFIQTFKFIGLGLLFAIYHDTNRNTVVSMLVSSVFGANLKVTPRPH